MRLRVIATGGTIDKVYFDAASTYDVGDPQVGPLFKEAAAIFLKNIWRTYESSASLTNEFDVPISSFPHFGIPNAVKEMLPGEWREGSGIGD